MCRCFFYNLFSLRLAFVSSRQSAVDVAAVDRVMSNLRNLICMRDVDDCQLEADGQLWMADTEKKASMWLSQLIDWEKQLMVGFWCVCVNVLQ